MSKLYDLVNWRLQNLQINCFLGREARPGAVPVAVTAATVPRRRRRSNGDEKTGEKVSYPANGAGGNTENGDLPK